MDSLAATAFFLPGSAPDAEGLLCHTPQPTPPFDDDEDEEEEDDRGSSGGNIDPDDDEGWSDDDDEDDDETLWTKLDARAWSHPGGRDGYRRAQSARR
jgi:hypothetical protein